MLDHEDFTSTILYELRPIYHHNVTLTRPMSSNSNDNDNDNNNDEPAPNNFSPWKWREPTRSTADG